MIVTKIKIIIDNSDNTHSETESVIPHEVAGKFMCSLITWKDDWLMDVRTVEDFQKSRDEFLEEQKMNNPHENENRPSF